MILPSLANPFPNPSPKFWSGRAWCRILCSQDSTAKFACFTANCCSVKPGNNGAIPPATLAEFTLNGYNLPMPVVPKGGASSDCSATGCLVDLDCMYPSKLRVTAGGGWWNG
ncbi:hypothetical protein Nepgr_004820 [Nepenthes gracilis]|uniref:Thaumatin-like protein n=1 Tax=Nepenthes gracilis TaxID=150966 RepID=A0AAD3S210_NEPGR|nr:hypothetical protein Nepgr_004820 [Nepenthes gracilis]